MLLTQLQQHHRAEQTTQLINGGLGGGGSLSSPTQTSASSASNLSSRSDGDGDGNNSQMSSSPAPSASSSSPASAVTDLSSCLRDADADDDELMTGMTMISPPAALEDNFSALQRLQFALEKNALFSNVFSNHGQQQEQKLEGRRSQQQKQKHASARSRSSTRKSAALNYREDEDDETDHNGDSHKQPTAAGAPVESVSLEPAIPDNIFQCPLCAISCNERHSFNEHLVTHTQQSACPKCDFITSNSEELRDHMLEVHGLESVEVEVEDDQVPVPKVNAQSKVKKFKCKTCDHVSVTKLEFWTHAKSHIKQDKMLQCPKCPFVTEYKHHLEYHLRNHTGSKPFQCSHCQYSCVNKSMLASHLKSHSTIYQYRCADCDYATKYCHSLKMHLRKHGHSPQMVLNPDGTPNPLPIIDVYGTRRGPKLKKPNYSLIPISQLQVKVKKVSKAGGARKKASPKEKMAELNNNSTKFALSPSPEVIRRPQQQPLQIPAPRQCAPREKTPENIRQRPHSQPPKLVPPPPPLTPTTTTMLQGLLLQNANARPNSISYHHSAKHSRPHAVVEEKPVHVNLNNNINIPTAHLPMPKNMLELYATALNQYLLANNPVLFQQLLANNGAASAAMAAASAMAGAGAGGLSPNSAIAVIGNCGMNGNGTLMRRAESSERGHENLHLPAAAALDLRAGASPSHLPETQTHNSRKRTRKGRALRFDRQLSQQEHDDDSDNDNEDSVLDYSNGKFNNNNNYVSVSPRPRLNAKADFGVGGAGGDKCKYCDISFPDQFLYTMHMSYHFYGDSDPFLCKCGTKTKDKVAFFVHLTTEPH